jgi:23S rRNA (uracil1939-C5)-methyltransferase
MLQEPLLTGSVEKIVAGGWGLVRSPEGVVFLHQVLPGETVTYTIKDKAKGILWGETQEVLNAAPARIDPPCKYFGACGGCSFQHIVYTEQLVIKKDIFLENLSRIAGISEGFKGIKIHPSPPFGYRFRAKLKGNPPGQFGFIKKKTTDVLTIDHCHLFAPPMNDFLKLWNQQDKAPFFHQLDLNWRPGTQLLYGHLSHAPASGQEASLRSWPNTSISWPGSNDQNIFQVKAGSWHYQVSPVTFFQVNHFRWELLLHLIKERLKECRTALDLYCGVGFFIPLLAQVAEKYRGVESHPLSAQLARRNFPGAEIVDGPAEKYREMDVDLVIVDPPRSGLHRKVLGRLIGNRVPSIIYISCSPASLARDLREFIKHGYRVEDLEILDLFPQTPHIESIATLLKIS